MEKTSNGIVRKYSTHYGRRHGDRICNGRSFLKARNEVIICGRRKTRLLEAQKNHPEFHFKTCNVAEETDQGCWLNG